MAANPYVQGWREWDERYADLVPGKRNCQIVSTFFSIRGRIKRVLCELAPTERCEWAAPSPESAVEPLGGGTE